jgi:hypothetical protein
MLYPFTGHNTHQPDAPVKLTGRAALRLIALRRPRVLPDSTATARSSNGHYAPTVKRNDRTRSTQRPDATVPASGPGQERF